jgi:hypothetical protein
VGFGFLFSCASPQAALLRRKRHCFAASGTGFSFYFFFNA